MPCTVFSPTFEILSTSCILVVFASICVMAPSSSVRLYLSSEVYASHNCHWVFFSTGSLDCVRFVKPCFLHKDPLAIRSHFLCLRLFSLYSFDDMITVMVWPLSCTDMVFPKRLQWAVYNSNQSLTCLLILWVLQIWLQHWKRGPLGDTWGTCAVCRIFTCNR